MVTYNESPENRARRRRFTARLDRMLIRGGFGSTVRSDGTVIERTYNINPLVQFAMDFRLDNERSHRIYELYARHIYNMAQQEQSTEDWQE